MAKKRMIRYKIHFEDQFGPGSVNCYDTEEYHRMLDVLNNDPNCNVVWSEHYGEHGWEEI